jgi:glyoxylase-like metal-dependent hydrolase (beta-lactamase superfamily II)
MHNEAIDMDDTRCPFASRYKAPYPNQHIIAMSYLEEFSMKQIAPGFYYFTGLTVGRVYLIEDPDGLTIVDAAVPPSGKKILHQLAEKGHKPDDVKRILITHAHPDHVGSLPELAAATGAEVIASAIERPVIEGKISIPRNMNRLVKMPDTKVKGTPVTRPVQDGDMIETMGGMQVVLTPGHAPGHITFWQPQRKILIAGDVIFHRSALRLPPPILTVDMEENKRSIAKVVGLAPEIVCFGHGEPLTQNAAEQLKTFAKSVGAMN